MAQALVTTGLLGLGFDEGRYYALIDFSTDGEPVTIAFPPEFLGLLAEGALALYPQRASVGDDQESVEAFNAREGTITRAPDGRAVLRMAFGKKAEIRFLLPPGGAEALFEALRQHLSNGGRAPA